MTLADKQKKAARPTRSGKVEGAYDALTKRMSVYRASLLSGETPVEELTVGDLRELITLAREQYIIADPLEETLNFKLGPAEKDHLPANLGQVDVVRNGLEKKEPQRKVKGYSLG